jgi:hypothetical protein
VQAAAGYLRDAVHGGPIAAIGVSLGGAAILLARPPIPFEAIVLESVYGTFDEALDNRMRQYLGPLGPRLSGVLAWQMPLRLGITPSDLRPIDGIRQVQEPLLLIQGDKDRNTTLAQADRLFAAAPGPDKRLWVVHGAGHQDLYQFAPQEYQTRVTALLAGSLRVTAPSPVGTHPTGEPHPNTAAPGRLARSDRTCPRRPTAAPAPSDSAAPAPGSTPPLARPSAVPVPASREGVQVQVLPAHRHRGPGARPRPAAMCLPRTTSWSPRRCRSPTLSRPRCSGRWTTSTTCPSRSPRRSRNYVPPRQPTPTTSVNRCGETTPRPFTDPRALAPGALRLPRPSRTTSQRTLRPRREPSTPPQRGFPDKKMDPSFRRTGRA